MNIWKTIGLLGGLALVFLVVTVVSATNDYNIYEDGEMVFEKNESITLDDQELIQITAYSDKIELYETDNETLEIFYKKTCNSDRQYNQYEEGFVIEESDSTISITIDPLYNNWLYENWLAKIVTGFAEDEGVLKIGIPSDFNEDLEVGGSSGSLTAASLVLDEVYLKSSSGSLSVKDIEAGVLEIRASSGSMVVEDITSEGSTIIDSSSGRVTISEVNAYDLSIDVSSGSIKLKNIMTKEALKLKASSGTVTIETAEAGSVLVDVSSGSVNLSNIVSTGKLTVDGSSGRMTLEDVSASELDLSNSSGSINGSDLITKETNVSVSSGKIDIQGELGKVTTDGGSGSTTIRCETFGDNISIDASSGSIDLYLPDNAEFEAFIDKSSGGFDSNFFVNEKEDYDGYDLYAYTIDGKDGFQIYINTGSGSIDILEAH